jgi:hypothetical protein
MVKWKPISSPSFNLWTNLLTKAINLHGEFDFSDEALTDALRFDLESRLTVEWERLASPSPM